MLLFNALAVQLGRCSFVLKGIVYAFRRARNTILYTRSLDASAYISNSLPDGGQVLKTKELADIVGLSTGVIRDWTINQYKSYLSPTAQGGSGRVRIFTDQDAKIIALVAGLRKDGVPHSDIHGTLNTLQSEKWRDLPPLPNAPPGIGPIPMVPREASDTAITTQRAAFTREIVLAQERAENAESQLTQERATHDETRQSWASARELIGQLRGERRLLFVVSVALAVAGVVLFVLMLIAITGGA